jgi:hypothetical protein
MYLIAIKTFAHFVPLRRVIVIADSLSEQEKRTVRGHVDAVELLDIETVDTEGMPRGGTWERLITIVKQSSTAYTIQLDADTITHARPAEVVDCVAGNRSFTLGTGMGRRVISVKEASKAVSHLSTPTAHVQIVAETALDKISGPGGNYVRGNSAFAGFAKGAHDMHSLRNFSQRMSEILGKEKWNEWGSEQVASNYMIANSQNPYILPFERYRYYKSGTRIDSYAFIHFMGTYRFAGGAYRRLAREKIRSMLSS